MATVTSGYELPLLLFGGFRALIDRLHEELARQGHPGARPAHGFALQAIGTEGVTSAELGRRLGVSKQAAGKTVDRLARLGYVDRAASSYDGRAKVVRLTPLGVDMLDRSAAIFEVLHAEWVARLGEERVRDLESSLRAVVPRGLRVDVAAWLGTD
ncbi:MarR family winged helix-turn-helix transcriptional regulator [Actinophytocola oryzae]|uniref:DNA-binding MarR family transcriptional regulator n=1 Tax=Actinophytocola oryzae TaxID=502181 RepID=A0A4R7VYH1_9PSEU|nr:MarR family winged helix-turn-helix transcriptional regulator [Actinophytocola oryzae]TDV55233.1 DNA-binding MarR family transcriptional regulator [Actinophytocola oryzae]